MCFQGMGGWNGSCAPFVRFSAKNLYLTPFSICSAPIIRNKNTNYLKEDCVFFFFFGKLHLLKLISLPRIHDYPISPGYPCIPTGAWPSRPSEEEGIVEPTGPLPDFPEPRGRLAQSGSVPCPLLPGPSGQGRRLAAAGAWGGFS